MVFLLDANIFIQAKKDHYRFSTFPSYWRLLEARASNGHTMVSINSVKDEIDALNDDLSDWAKSKCPGSMFVPHADAKTIAVAPQITLWANSQSFTPAAIAEFLSVADYWLVSHAVAHNYTVVTAEKSEPLRKNKIKIPDACKAHGVPVCTPWDMLESLGVSF